MRLKLFNTLKREKEEIYPLNDKFITLYTCGPTVYDFAHIGNFRTYIFEDLLKRTLEFFGFKVKHVMNLTDIDDKTIKGALAKNISLDDYTKTYKKAFFEDIELLNIEKADYYPEATAYIPEMIRIIKRLLEKEIAYLGADGSIYFSIERFEQYGKLSHLNLDDLVVGKRVSLDEYEKENASDFVLWKSYDPKRDGPIFWESPFGKGRPGWHIECSAMSLKLLGDTIDIHCGGVDNIFPHHENEIAQSESYTGKEFVRCWAHSEHLIVDNKKMSKSLGNFYTLRDLLGKGYTPDQIRYLLLSVHYRTQLNFSFGGLDAAKSSLKRIEDFVDRLKLVDSHKKSGFVKEAIEKASELFSLALSDDLNISPALAALFDFIRDLNTLCDEEKISKKEAKEALEFLAKIDKVLGVLPLGKKEIEIPKEVEEALVKRQAARKEKDFKKADEYRDFILSSGFIIEDTSKGAILKKK